jgi:hypothetical protein
MDYQIPHLPMLGKGSILFDAFDANGNLTGYQHLGNCPNVEQEIKDETAELFQSINKVAGKIASALKKRTVTISIKGTDFKFSNMALVNAGTKSTLSTGSTPVTGEALASATATKKGKYFSTAGRNIGSVVVKQGATTLVLNTDYTIPSALEGLIYFPLTSAVDDAQAVTIDYTPTAVSISQVAGGTVPFTKGRLRFSPDPVDGKKIGVEWWVVNLKPAGGKLGLISDDYGNWELEAEVLADYVGHPNAPYFLMTDLGATSGQTGYQS